MSKKRKKKPSNFFTVKEYKKKFGLKPLTEAQEQAKLCQWIKDTYPNVLYVVDLAGIHLNMKQRAVYKTRCKRGVPDLMINEWHLDKYCGLAIEFKRTGEYIIHQKGPNKGKFKIENDHLREQLEYITELKNRYWAAGFVIGLEPAKLVIRAYLEANSKSLSIINQSLYPKIKLK